MSDVVQLPMFPLGSVLFPAMPLPLKVFEPRYLQLLQDVLPDPVREFGVVLIERGQEVGGGEQRFGVGTVAQVADLKVGDGYLSVLTEGTRRIEVVEWLDDAPYPRATVRDLPPLQWDESLRARRDEVEALVRATLARLSEVQESSWSSTVQLDDDPVDALWQLAAIAPVGPLDQLGLLKATSAAALLDAVEDVTRDAALTLEARGL